MRQVPRIRSIPTPTVISDESYDIFLENTTVRLLGGSISLIRVYPMLNPKISENNWGSINLEARCNPKNDRKGLSDTCLSLETSLHILVYLDKVLEGVSIRELTIPFAFWFCIFESRYLWMQVHLYLFTCVSLLLFINVSMVSMYLRICKCQMSRYIYIYIYSIIIFPRIHAGSEGKFNSFHYGGQIPISLGTLSE